MMPGLRTLFATALITAGVLTAGVWAQGAPADSRVRLREGVSRDALDERAKRTYDVVVNPTTPYGRGLPTPIGMWMHSPRMAEHVLPLYMYLRFGGDSWHARHFDVRQVEIAILVAARNIDSQYQWTSHEPTALKVGVEPEIVDIIKHGRTLDAAGFRIGEKDRLIIRVGRELLGERRLGADTFAAAVKVFGRDGMADLTGLLSFYEFLMLSSNATFDLTSAEKPLMTVRQAPFASRGRAGAAPAAAARARLPIVSRTDLDDEGRKLYDRVVNAGTPLSQGLPPHAAVWLHSPGLAEHALPAYLYLHHQNQLGPRLTALAALAAARHMNSPYLWAAHEPGALSAGLDPALVDAVRQNRSVPGLGAQESLVLQFGRELFTDRRVSPRTFAEAHKVFGLVGVTDLAALMAFQEFMLYSSIIPFDLPVPASQRPLLPTS